MRKYLWSIGLLLTTAAHAAPPDGHLPGAQQLVQTLTLLLVAVTLALGLSAVLTCLAAWRPAAVRAGAERLRQRPFRALLTGSLTLVAALLAALLLQLLPKPLAGLLGVLLLAGLAVAILGGLALVAHDLGERVLASLTSRHVGSAVAAVATGAVLLVLCGALPLLGQLLHLVAIASGLGALLSRSRPPAPPA
jgi:Na+/melibiose symporter-like transporter